MKKLCYSIGLSVLIVFVLFACDKPKVDSIPILCIGIEIVDSNGNNLIGTKLYENMVDQLQYLRKTYGFHQKYIDCQYIGQMLAQRTKRYNHYNLHRVEFERYRYY